MKRIKRTIYIVALVVTFYSCSPADGNHPGTEYMPDMGHSIAVEGNVYTYYFLNTWDSASTIKLKDLAIPKDPPEGTVARGYAGVALAAGERTSDEVIADLRGTNSINGIAVPINGSVPYHYEDTEEERTRATAEIIDNPFPITADGLEEGEVLYNRYCGICHGENGGGLGYLVREADPAKGIEAGKYPVAPANLLLDSYASSSNGRYYHAIMYGKNVMGAYKGKLSYEERWNVIHWVRHLQAKDKGLVYDETDNAYNKEFGTPMAWIEPKNEKVALVEPAKESYDEADHSGGQHSDNNQSGGGSGGKH